jgi:predicted HicB family RNase H-like nuclease
MRKNDPEARHSGRLLVRMPRDLHDQLAAQAHEQRVPLNQLVVALLSGGVAWRSKQGPGGAAPSRA